MSCSLQSPNPLTTLLDVGKVSPFLSQSDPHPKTDCLPWDYSSTYYIQTNTQPKQTRDKNKLTAETNTQTQT